MSDLRSFLKRLGHLHDATVLKLAWLPEVKRLRLEIEDLCWNFEGLPEYPGPVPGYVELQGVKKATFDLTEQDDLMICGFEVESEGADQFRAKIQFSNGHIIAWFRTADFTPVTLLEPPASIGQGIPGGQ